MKKIFSYLALTLCCAMSFATKYTLVTSTDDLKSGDQVIIACNTAGCVAGAFNVKNIPAIYEGVVFADDLSYVTVSGAYEYTINGGGSTWVLSYEGNPIGCTAASNALSVDPSAAKYSNNWELSIDANGDINYLCKSNSYANTYLYYNNSAKWFANYDKKQKVVQFYKKTTTTEPTIECGEKIDFGQIQISNGIGTASVGFDIEGLNLTEAITLSISAGSTNFTLDKNQLPAEGGKITVSFQATQSGDFSGTLLVKSGSVSVSVALHAKTTEVSAAGTKDQPFACSDVINMAIDDASTKAWVAGYILGSAATGPKVSTNAQNTSIALADDLEGTNLIAVQLPNNEVREALNVVDHPENIGLRIKVYGSLQSYFGGAGIKNTSEYEFIDDQPVNNDPKINCQTTVNFGQIALENNTCSKNAQLEIKGINLTEDINLQITEGSVNFMLGQNTLPAQGGSVDIEFNAQQSGIYQGKLVVSSSSVSVEVSLVATVSEVSAAGTKEQPYSCGDIISMGIDDSKTKGWVMGFILGSATTGPKVNDNPNATSLILADDNEGTNMIAVQLPSGAIRDSLNIVDNPDNIGRQVKVYGSLEKYFGTSGVKSVSEYEFIDNPQTAIELVNEGIINRPQKEFRNGQLIIIRNGHEYNAAGQIIK